MNKLNSKTGQPNAMTRRRIAARQFLVALVAISLFVVFRYATPATDASDAIRNAYMSRVADISPIAYIGPGAGIALAGSFLAVLAALFSAMLAVISWPVRWIWRAWRNRKALAKAKVRRVVILGLDGLDPNLVEELIEEGSLPNLAKLKAEGSYRRLATTWPPLSPVAWSSFSTGTNPGKHNIFDFISRNKANYGPMMSSVKIGKPRRTLKLGRYLIPLSSTPITGLRKSKPFWNVLGASGIFSSVLRVPITFPPDRFRGVQLSAMCVPDLRGTQGTFCYFSESQEGADSSTGGSDTGGGGGQRVIVKRNGRGVTGILPGPLNPMRTDAVETKLAFKVVPGAGDSAVLHIGGEKIMLRPNQYTDWVSVPFPLVTGMKVRGVCRFMLKQFSAPFSMYCTPINIDPDKPVMPISHPKVFSIYLAKLLGTYSTLGLAEDTWSLSEGINSEAAFLKQAYDIHAEREQMFFDSLSRVRRGMVTCVFDGPDRIQHMFWRFHEDGHPALSSTGADGKADRVKERDEYRDTIREMYKKMDELVGRTIEEVDPNDALFVMSDHGFKSFRRGIDLNAWLRDNGYLKLKDGANSSDAIYLSNVDWAQTRAYAIGLAGIFINQKERESQGIVLDGQEKQQLVQEICNKLTGLRDKDENKTAIEEAVSSGSVYFGPYVNSAPDVIVGYNEGYRVSWDAAVGKCSAHVFSDNVKAWSGDHCIHPRLVPGVLFSNLALRDAARIIDLAPTALELLGVQTPAYMDGKSLLA